MAKTKKEETGSLTGKNIAAPATKASATPTAVTEFEWSSHNKLSWDDFRGSANTENDELAAAATHCSIGLKLCKTDRSDKMNIVVYNNFYTNKSWVKEDAKLPEVLTHEQGHFDLCELYTRKLRREISGLDPNREDVRFVLQNIYSSVKNEYENTQQQYERETIHGTNLAQQKKWTDLIAAQLN